MFLDLFDDMENVNPTEFLSGVRKYAEGDIPDEVLLEVIIIYIQIYLILV